MPTPGQLVDRYVVERLLGVGGSAEVWQVRHQLLGSRYALKVLPPSRASAEAQARLLEEGRAQAHLEHPCILPVRDVFRVQGRLALLMRLVEGPSLRELLLHQPRLPLDEALALGRCLLEGLAFIHDRGLVHCDLKPENILLEVQSGRLQPCIADFGLARSSAEATGADIDRPARDRGPVGTPGYVAPEQLLGAGEVDHRADLFSLGAILFEILSGRPAFPQETLAEVRRRRPPSDALADLPAPASIRALLAELLQPDPRDRPARCQEVLARLPPAAPEALSAASAAFLAARLLQAPATPREAPPTPRAAPPAQEGLVGRGGELAEASSRLGWGVRLLSITGLGGVGKTRLAQHLGRALAADFPGGVWSCDLSAATSGPAMLAAIGRALRVELEDAPAARIGGWLAERGRALLILDPIEPLREAARALLPGWLAAAPEVAVVVTSRLPLGLDAEEQLRLAPLAPEEAAALFFQRARARDAQLHRGEDLPAVQALVELLDGLPLAIELAATRTALLSPQELLDRLQHEVAAGTGGRPQGLEGVLAWSWEHVSPAARLALAQLSVLEGSFSLAFAERIVDLSALAAPAWPEEALAELIEANLLQVRRHPEPGRGRRFQLLAGVRRLAARHLPPDARRAAEDRLAWACLAWTWEEALREPHHLLCAAERLLARGEEIAPHWRLLQRAHYLLMHRGPYAEAAALLARAAAQMAPDAPERAALALCRCWTLQATGQIEEAGLAAGEAVARYEALGDADNLRRAREGFALLPQDAGDIQGSVDRLEALLAAGGSDAERDRLRINLGNALRILGRYAEARAHLEQAGSDPARVAMNLGAIDIEQGRLAAGRERSAAALARSRAEARQEGEVQAHQNLAEAALMQGRLAEADQHVAAALEGEAALGHRGLRAALLATTGVLRHLQDRLDPAAEHLQAALDAYAALRNPLLVAVHQSELAVVRWEQGRLDEATSLLRRALALPLARPTAFSALIAARAALVLALAGHAAEAGQALEAAPPAANPHAAITLLLARAALHRALGEEPLAREALLQAGEALAGSELSPLSPPGRLLHHLQAAGAPRYTPTQSLRVPQGSAATA